MDNCIVCSEQKCDNERCKDILESVEEIKTDKHIIEQYISELWP